MKRVKPIIAGIFFLVSSGLMSQTNKKPLSISDFDNWKHLEDKAISNNGEWVFYEVNPYEGDGKIHLWSAGNKSKKVFERGAKARFSAHSDYIAFQIQPFTDSVRKMKLDKVPKNKLPKDSLGIFVFDSGKLFKKEKIKSFKLAEKNSGWMAYQHEKYNETKDTTDNKKTKKADKTAPEATKLTIFHPSGNKEYNFNNVTEYSISEQGDLISFIRLKNDSLLKSTLYVFNTKKEKLDSIFSENGLAKNITPDHKGNQLAFIHSSDTIKEKVYSLYFWNEKAGQSKKIVDTLTQSIPDKWTVGEHGRIYFSENDERLFFGTKERVLPEPKDTLLDEEKVNVDVWSWKDPLLQPEQLKKVEKEKKRTYLAVYHIKDNKIVQLADEKIRNVNPILKGNGDLAIGINYQPYQKIRSWEMPPYKDVYLVDINTGNKRLIREKIQSRIDLSPNGKYFYWYSFADSSWYAQEVKTNKTENITGELPVNFYNKDHDYPNDPSSYGIAGWTEDDEYLLVNDRFDIWKLDPSGKDEAENLTKGLGRKEHIEFRYIKLDRDQEFIDPKEELLLRAFNKDTKASGYYKAEIRAKGNPQKLVMDDYLFYTPQKAKNEDKVIWQKSSFQEYPNVWYSNLNFENPIQLSEANPQKEDYIWGNAELVKWTAPDGREAEGLLYKPENFDPEKKYPMMVYFYRLSSDGLHRHHVPKPSRSTINRTFYASNGYMIFVPNIRYDIGYPGESAHEYVTSGTLSMIDSRPYIDKERIGLQGQSWGGYQIAHIVTMTDMYAAASPGAPVSNMTSAYGGIRWGSGMSRMFQYEETQSRIGGTLWEKPLQYIQNSPVFYAPRVNTPQLIRHNDGDGAVPWYQGIEYFVALRRLGKPVWMLNYNGAPHNERAKSPNCEDLSIRMKQFFDHYLMDKPAPVWMKEGIPAIKKGKTRGYELVK